MKRLLLISFLLATTSYLKAQGIITFKEDFKIALGNKITNNLADSLVNKHYSLLLWFFDDSQDVKAYPLKEMRNEDEYKNNIDKLFADTSQKVKNLACLLAVSTYDTAKINDVKKVLKHSGYKSMIAAKSLLVLGDKDLDPIVKCIIANNFDETVQYLTIDFLNFEKDILEKFACDSLLSNDIGVQYLSVKAMGQIPYKTKNEQLLKQAVADYDMQMKGWPLAVLAKYKAKDILPLVKPYLENQNLREVCLRALIASEDANDINYVKELIAKKKFDKDLMNNLLNSNNEFYLQSWLKMVEENAISDDYFIDLKNKRLVGNKKYFEVFSKIIYSSLSEQQLYSLMEFYEGMYDEDTKVFLKRCLEHPTEGVREKAKKFLSKMPN